MIVVTLLNILAMAPQRIHLLDPTGAPGSGGISLIRLVALAAGIVLLVAAGLLWLRLARNWMGGDPSARAFTALCRSLGVSNDQRARLKEIATASDLSPTALLFSEHAFFRASEHPGAPRLDPRELLELESAVFRKRVERP